MAGGGGGGIIQLKEQVEANLAVLEASMKEIEGKNDQMGARQDELDHKMTSLQTSVNALSAIFNNHFEWLRQQFDPPGGGGTTNHTSSVGAPDPLPIREEEINISSGGSSSSLEVINYHSQLKSTKI